MGTQRGIDRVILAGMSANLCTESHMRELIEQGFDVTVVSDGTAGGKTPDLGDGYAAAMTNFKFIANAVILSLFTLAPWFFYPDVQEAADVRKAMFDVGVFLFGLGVSTAFFAYAAYREYQRVAVNRGSGSRRRTANVESRS